MVLQRRSGRARGAVRGWIWVIVGALSVSACGSVVELQPGDPVEFVQQPQTSKILAADGTVLAELHAEQDREDVGIDEVADVAIRAVVSIEDRRFFLHRGVDAPAIIRAAAANVSAGGVEQGGSTLTQQYVKNTMTGPARTIERKLKEAALAYQLEQRYSKEEILERYLNTVYFGKGAYGIRAAAQRFFGVEPSELDLPAAATLAGMIASPSRYDPYENPEAALARRQLVLDAMVSAGQVSRAEADEAAAADLDLAPLDVDDTVLAPYVVEEVKRQIQHDPNGTMAPVGVDVDERAERLFTGGLRVFTTLDPRVQGLADGAVRQVFEEEDALDGGPSAAVVVTDPTTGGVKALVGGRDFFDPDDPQARFNLATQGRRQPGSAFKPIVLAAALSRGITMDRQFPGGNCVSFERVAGWEDGVCNYGGTAHGSLNLREATVRSVNTAFARLAVELGPTALLEMAQTMGLRDLPPVHSLALGSGEVTPWAMAGAYGVLADLGRYHEPYLIERIETASGEALYEHDHRSFQAVDESIAFVITQTLQEVVRRGTGVRAQLAGVPQAGKTGTSQDSADAWFVGYTPNFLAAVWVGFPEGRIPMVPPATSEVVEGGRWPAQIWKALAEPALAGIEAEGFPVPEVDLVTVEVDVERNCLPNPYTPAELIAERSYLVGSEPTERCKEPTGPPIDDVPDVAGLPLAVAERLLGDKGFLVDVRAIASDVYPPGIITRQRPAAGGTTSAEDGHAVVVWVSTNSRGRSAVPNVLELDAEQATTLLESAGWVVEQVLGCPSEGCGGLSSGEVWDQSPEPHDILQDHSVVRIVAAP